MFKSKLQEYCQSKTWLLPEYGVAREGPDHCPSFKAVVQVNGVSFTTPDPCKSIKEAHNVAAKLAFEHFVGSSTLDMRATNMPASNSIQHPETQESSRTTSCHRVNRATKDHNAFKDVLHIYKNQLQIYAQKRNLELPVYSVERVGPCHASCFKSKVTVEGKTYESEEFFHTVKEAESAAAKVALASLFPAGIQEDDPCIYKNLLQEYLQKENSCLPKYTTSQVGLSHMPVFVSTVEIQGEIFRGKEAKTKKQAEMDAAKVAYIALKGRRCMRDGNLNVVGVHVRGTPEFSSAGTHVVGRTNSSNNFTSDPQPVPDDQFECEDKCREATPNPFMRMPKATTSSESAPVLKATPPASGPMSCSNNPNPSISSEHANGSSISSEHANGSSVLDKKKKKIMVLPRSSTRSPPNAVVMHCDEKWIAMTENYY